MMSARGCALHPGQQRLNSTPFTPSPPTIPSTSISATQTCPEATFWGNAGRQLGPIQERHPRGRAEAERRIVQPPRAQLTLDQDEQIWIRAFDQGTDPQPLARPGDPRDLPHQELGCLPLRQHPRLRRGQLSRPFATVDLTAIHGCGGAFAFVQVGELCTRKSRPDRSGSTSTTLSISSTASRRRSWNATSRWRSAGRRRLFMDFISARKHDFRKVFDSVNLSRHSGPESSAASRYAVIKPDSRLGENVLIAQRAYIDNSVLEWCERTGELLHHQLVAAGKQCDGARRQADQRAARGPVFVGFNSFVRGLADAPLAIGQGTIVMPHTIIDLQQPLSIPAEHLVWGHISGPDDLQRNSIPLGALERVSGGLTWAGWSSTQRHDLSLIPKRIDHILRPTVRTSRNRVPATAERTERLVQHHPGLPRLASQAYTHIDIRYYKFCFPNLSRLPH